LFSDNSTGNVTSWNWYFEGAIPESSTLQNPSVTYDTTGLFDVGLIVSDGIDFDTAFLADFIYSMDIPGAPDIPQQNGISLSNPGFVSEFYTSVVNWAGFYEWIFEPQNAVDSIWNNDTICYIDFVDYWEGLGSIKVRAVNSCGVSAFSPEFNVPVLWLNSYQPSTETQKLFPNPANKMLNIPVAVDTKKSDLSIYVFDLTGQLVMEQKTAVAYNGIVRLNVSQLNRGCYVLKVSGKETFSNHRFIVAE
jgi:PKD repeat protein